MVGLTITSEKYVTSDVPVDVVHVLHSDIIRQRNFYNFQQFETKFADGYGIDGEMGPLNLYG